MCTREPIGIQSYLPGIEEIFDIDSYHESLPGKIISDLLMNQAEKLQFDLIYLWITIFMKSDLKIKLICI